MVSSTAVSGSGSCIGEELGDLLFAAVNVARMLDKDPEECLGRACEKFIERFDRVEQLALARGIGMKDAPKQQLVALWQEAKSQEK